MAKGKTFKQALTACMRKLLVLMNTLVAGPGLEPVLRDLIATTTPPPRNGRRLRLQRAIMDPVGRYGVTP